MRRTMNKTTVIIVLAIFLTISVGYALFSDTITIEGTATAQGNFDITATCQTSVSPEILTAFGMSEEDTNEFLEYPNFGYENDICTVSDDKVTFTTDLKYPGAGRIFTVKLTNTGTVDAVIKMPKYDTVPYFTASGSIKVYNKSDDSLYEEITDSYNSQRGYWDSNFYNYINVYPQIRLENALIADTDGTLTVDEEWLYENEFIYSNTNNEHYLRLKPNQSVYILGQAFWDEDSEISGYYAETKTNFNFVFNQLASDLELITDPSKDNICLGGC